jgi:hypothetical protein
MPREISDEEYNFLQSRRQIADFVEPLYNHPKWGKEAKRLIKQVYPDVKIPDYDLDQQITARFDEEKKARDEEKAAEAQRKQDEAWQRARDSTKQKYGMTDEQLARLEDWMVENNVGSYDVAVAARAAMNPRTSEPEYDAGHWHHERIEGFKEAVKDPEAYTRNEILQAIYRDEQRAREQR